MKVCCKMKTKNIFFKTMQWLPRYHRGQYLGDDLRGIFKWCHRVLFCLVPLLVLAHGCGPEDKTPKSEVLVTGGRKVGVSSDLPTRVSTVALTNYRLADGGRSFCTGTLIHPLVVLTAAHCVTNLSGEILPLAHVAFGNQVSANPLLLNKMVAVAVHRGWKGDLSDDGEPAHDLALVRMSATFKGAEPIEILDKDRWLPKKILIAGYGVSKGRMEDDSGLLRATYMKIININPHQMIMTAVGYPREGYALLPTGFGDFKRKRVRSGACAGDSGGPAYYKKTAPPGEEGNSEEHQNQGGWTLTGVTSYGWEFDVEGEARGQERCIGQNGYTYLPPYKKALEQAVSLLVNENVSETNHRFRFSDDGLKPMR
jgi:hypothetical protein